MEKGDFDQIYNIMDASFPDEEKRNYEDQLALLEDERCKLFVKKNDAGEIIIFLTAWILDGVSFIEHVATDPKYRNLGLGSKFLTECIEALPNPIVLEVEPPISTITKRRVELYKRMGFYLNDYPYKQPPLQSHTQPCELRVMSYPSPITKREFLAYRNEIFNAIYKILPADVGLED